MAGANLRPALLPVGRPSHRRPLPGLPPPPGRAAHRQARSGLWPLAARAAQHLPARRSGLLRPWLRAARSGRSALQALWPQSVPLARLSRHRAERGHGRPVQGNRGSRHSIGGVPRDSACSWTWQASSFRRGISPSVYAGALGAFPYHPKSRFSGRGGRAGRRNRSAFCPRTCGGRPRRTAL